MISKSKELPNIPRITRGKEQYQRKQQNYKVLSVLRIYYAELQSGGEGTHPKLLAATPNTNSLGYADNAAPRIMHDPESPMSTQSIPTTLDIFTCFVRGTDMIDRTIDE